MQRHLVAEKHFDKIDIFEQRSSTGGVWNYSPGSFKTNPRTVAPQLKPSGSAEQPVWRADDEYTIISPLYDRLEANSMKEMMQFPDKPFPADEKLYPPHASIRKYVQEYADDVKHMVKLETQVLDVRKSAGKWNVVTRNLRTGTMATDNYDAVVVANGHYNDPYIPTIVGIESWNEAYPGVISHSKFYDAPESFANKKVVIVGNSASGIDISVQIGEFCKGKPLLSARSPDDMFSDTADNIDCPEIMEFLSPKSHDRAVRFADGRVEAEIDAILFCTGYLYSFPFFSSLNPPVVTDGQRVMNLYQQLFYTYDPTLVFPVIQYKVIPFTAGGNQAAVFARVWSGRLSLPLQAEMKAWEENEVAERGNLKSYHVLGFPLDVNYLNFLHDWAAAATKRPGLENNGNGRQAVYWGDKEKWLRVRGFPHVKKAFMERARQGVKVTSMAELGFGSYEEWKMGLGGRSRL